MPHPTKNEPRAAKRLRFTIDSKKYGELVCEIKCSLTGTLTDERRKPLQEGDDTMIDQTKEKKDQAEAAKLEAKKKGDAARLQQLAEKERAELNKDQKGTDKIKAESGDNASKSMQPIGTARVLNDKAELYSEPEKKGRVLNTLSAQRQIEVLEQKGDELKVLVDGKIGYIARAMTDLGTEQKGAEKKAPEPIGTATVSVAALRVRTAPDKESSYIGTLRQADKVNIYAEKEGFLEVHIGDQIGYISAEHTDHAGAQKEKNLTPNEGSALQQAPEQLQELLAQESLSVAEIQSAKDMIAQCPENIRGDLNEALLAKATREEQTEAASNDDASEFEALATSLELIGVQNPDTEKSFAAYLAQLKRDQKLPDSAGMQNWGSLANAMGVSYASLASGVDREMFDKAFWSETARAQLRDGHAVMTCIDGQAVRVEAIEEEGLVITTPDGATLDLESYAGKAEQKGKGQKGLLAFDRLADVNLGWVISMG